jgi:hypothetical protein
MPEVTKEEPNSILIWKQALTGINFIPVFIAPIFINTKQEYGDRDFYTV